MDSKDRHDEVSQYEQSAHFYTVMTAVIILCFNDMQALLMLMREYNQNYQNSFQHPKAKHLGIYIHMHIYMQDSNWTSKHHIYTSKAKGLWIASHHQLEQLEYIS